MREIDNNLNNVNFKGISKRPINEEPTQPQPTPAPAQEKEIKDLANMPAAFLGKSQIASDSTETDMQLFIKNPEKIEKVNDLFDAYAEKFGYDEAVRMLDEFTTTK